MRLVERSVAPRAGLRLGVVGRFGGVPGRAPDRPRDEMLEPAEHGPAVAGRLVRPVAVALVDRAPAPAAAIAHTTPSGSTKRRAPAPSRGGPPPPGGGLVGGGPGP